MVRSNTTHPLIYKKMGSPNLFLIHHSFSQFKGQRKREQKSQRLEKMESQKQERRVKKMKRVTKIIALASIFSFILSYSSFISSLQQRLHLLYMYSNLVDKKYMFLLCNGIVGFILRSFRGNSETLLHGKTINIVEHTKEVAVKDMRETEVKKAVALLDKKSASKEKEEEEEGRVVLFRGGEEEEEEEIVVLFREGGEEVTLVVEDDDEGILVQELALVRIDDNDDDDGDGDEIEDSLLSSEDLNKKCEEFIRKMKAEIRFGKRSI